jgi:YHS domain-containing protein
VLILWLLRRFLSKFMPSRATKPDSSSIANYMVKDPICGMYMDSRLALRLERKSKSVFFCSEKCKKSYLEIGNTE